MSLLVLKELLLKNNGDSNPNGIVVLFVENQSRKQQKNLRSTSVAAVNAHYVNINFRLNGKNFYGTNVSSKPYIFTQVKSCGALRYIPYVTRIL